MKQQSKLWVWLFLVSSLQIQAQQLTQSWTFKTNDKILSSPIISEGTLFIGSEDRTFYALDIETGKEKWHFKTPDRIQSTATVYKHIVFFESGNTFYALNKTTGRELWQYDPGWALWGYKIDPYDDKRSKAIVHNGVFYIGSSLGLLLGFDALTGEKVLSINSDYNQPIRTTPTINNNILYFGDWAGQIYAYDLKNRQLLWKKKTYEKKLYETFGSIASEIQVSNNKLYFGARNPELQILDAQTAEPLWNFKDPQGGWIIGDPVIENGNLYIGGSDNFKMLAFNVNDGKLKWTFDSKLNIYSKPVVTDKYVIFTAGNAYKPNMPGRLFVIHKSSGTLASTYEVPKATFSSPVLYEGFLYFGVYDGLLYKLKFSEN